MGRVPSAAQTSFEAECRQCCSFCDRLVLPSGCIEADCRYLYVYDDEETGARYMGCLNKVFTAEIDVALFREAERTRHGYGGVRMTRTPLPQCQSAVERAYGGDGEAFECANPGFFEVPTDERAAGAFDLRDRL